jgi:replication-associated recombination protein RarA
MKKFLIVSLIAFAATPAFAAKVKNFVSSTTASSQTDVSTTECTLLQSAVKINTSVANIGTVDCDTTTANIGVSVANTSGKNNVYSAGSAGGGISTTSTGTTVPATSDTDAAAAAKSGTT